MLINCSTVIEVELRCCAKCDVLCHKFKYFALFQILLIAPLHVIFLEKFPRKLKHVLFKKNTGRLQISLPILGEFKQIN